MSKKPWLENEYGRVVDGFLGAYGCATGNLETEEDLVGEAILLFELQAVTTLRQAATAIRALSKPERKARARRNLGSSPSQKTIGEEVVDAISMGFVDHKALLDQVISAVISRGAAPILHELPDVLAYLGSRVPTVGEVLGDVVVTLPAEVSAGDRVYSFTCARQVA